MTLVNPTKSIFTYEINKSIIMFSLSSTKNLVYEGKHFWTLFFMVFFFFLEKVIDDYQQKLNFCQLQLVQLCFCTASVFMQRPHHLCLISQGNFNPLRQQMISQTTWFVLFYTVLFYVLVCSAVQVSSSYIFTMLWKKYLSLKYTKNMKYIYPSIKIIWFIIFLTVVDLV